jgi:serine/threonine protein kinase
VTLSCVRCRHSLEPSHTACSNCGESIPAFLREYFDKPVGGNYRIVSILGRGGMGEVYRAHHIHLNADCVIKVMRPDLAKDPSLHERFVREARLARRIRHPNVAMLYDFSVLPDGTYYMVWEFIDGVTLGQLIRSAGALEPKRVARLSIDALRGLDAIHRVGFVHRDISPDNIIITTEGGTETAKVIDLGIAKQEDATGDFATLTGVFIGKLKYASPEQLGALAPEERLDARSDVYSFGLVMYEMLAGQAAFTATTPHQYMVMQLKDDPRRLSDRALLAAGRELEPLVFRALRKERGERFASAADFADAIQTVMPRLDAAPTPRASATRVAARPPATARRRSFARLAVALLPVIGLLLIIAIVGGSALLWARRPAPQTAVVRPHPAPATAPARPIVAPQPIPQPVKTETVAPSPSPTPPAVEPKPKPEPRRTPLREKRPGSVEQPPAKQPEAAAVLQPEPQPVTAPQPEPQPAEPEIPAMTPKADPDLRPGRYERWRRRIDRLEIVHPFAGAAYDGVTIAAVDTAGVELPSAENDPYHYREPVSQLLAEAKPVFTDAFRKAYPKPVFAGESGGAGRTLSVRVHVVTADAGNLHYGGRNLSLGPTIASVEGEVVDGRSGAVLLRFQQTRRYDSLFPGLSYGKRPKILREKLEQIAGDLAFLLAAF